MKKIAIARRSVAALILGFCLWLPAATAQALEPTFAHSGLAIRGYDPVAYFTDAKPLRGKADFAYDWQGATWNFVNAENRDRFAADPARFAPQYGGYCAWAVSQGYTASTDPDAWKIVDDKLYLNYSKGVQKRWQKDIPGLIAKGDANWPRLLAE